MGKTRLTPEDWAAAALDALAEGGLGAVRVESLAPSLGASKGSFYWHFSDRAALVEAALTLWEDPATDVVLRMLDGPRGAPLDRLRRLFTTVLEDPRAGDVDAALGADAAEPRVAAALERVARRRLHAFEGSFTDLGFARGEARRRALSAYCAYLGIATLRRQAPALLPAGRRALRAHADAQAALLAER